MEYVATESERSWYDVGIALAIPSSQLDSIQREQLGNNLRCYRSVFQTWERTQVLPFEWLTIIKALKQGFVRENSLADKLEKRLQF